MNITREQLFGTNCERPGERLNFKYLHLHHVWPAALRAPSSHIKTSVCARNKHTVLRISIFYCCSFHTRSEKQGKSQRTRCRREAEDLVNPRGTSKDGLSGPLASAREGRADVLTAPRTRKGQEC